ncbi:hypothetical protein BJF79_00785 [Actinomadura sp. CNU-125]|nr:hypothetical protein BJF79_00785 [Actinomadura sp. CNU-125]
MRRLAPRTDRRSWEDRLKVTVKGVVAAVAAWLIAAHLVGHAMPYFAPLAALLGVYPTVARSVRESIGYAAGFLVGAGLAIPVGTFIGPNAAGIAAVLVVGLLLSSWRGFGNQSSQVAFTALFALLVGGNEVAGYVRPRLADVAVGLAVGLIVNFVLFPPLYLRRGEYAVAQARDAWRRRWTSWRAASPTPRRTGGTGGTTRSRGSGTSSTRRGSPSTAATRACAAIPARGCRDSGCAGAWPTSGGHRAR